MKYYRTRCVQKFLVRFKGGVIGKQLPVYCDISKVSSVSKNTGDTKGNIISQRVEHKYLFSNAKNSVVLFELKSICALRYTPGSTVNWRLKNWRLTNNYWFFPPPLVSEWNPERISH